MITILIAEDNDDVRMVLHRIFTRAGFTVLAAADGRAALHQAQEHHPDLVLTDLDMPRLNGLQLCQAIRQDPNLQDVPVAILSGGLQPGDARIAAAQACGVLLKPFSNDDLVTSVAQLLNEHGQHSPCPHHHRDTDIAQSA